MHLGPEVTMTTNIIQISSIAVDIFREPVMTWERQSNAVRSYERNAILTPLEGGALEMKCLRPNWHTHI